MAPESSPTASEDERIPVNGTDTSKAEAALKARLSRKRTKTGCLTCRKRRIKCGEERPVCKNCIKSKRLCEGYYQRVVFKSTHFDYQPAPNGGAHITFQAGPVPGYVSPDQHGQPPQYMLDGTPYPTWQPHAAGQFPPPINGQQYMMPQQAQHMAQAPQLEPPRMQAVPVGQFAALPYHAQLHAQQQYHAQQETLTFEQAIAEAQQSLYSGAYQMPSHIAASQVQHMTGADALPMTGTHDSAHWFPHTQAPSSVPEHMPVPIPAPAESSVQSYNLSQMPVDHGDSRSWTMPTYTPRPELSRPIDQYQYLPASGVAPQQNHSVQDIKLELPEEARADFHTFAQKLPTIQRSTYLLQEAAVERQDDDYYDIDSDEEMDSEQALAIGKDFSSTRTLGAIFMRQNFDVQNMQMRRFDTFIQSGMLDYYRVEQVANPLKNPATARVFAHFISATGPGLTIFDRHSVSSSVLFSNEDVSVSRQGLWTYILPMMALHHQGLLHAMLAMASLQIARLEGASVTPSMQHYAWALKHIHKCVASPNKKKRLAVTTIAASMLLGFYELLTADHMKWNTHLMGAKQLLVETDFANMTRQFRRMKQEKAAMEQIYGRRNSITMHLNGLLHDDGGLDQVNDVDDKVISQLVGREVRYGEQGHIEDPQGGLPQELDLKGFEIRKDLFWWYCKQDAYQSIVSGNPLLLDYGRWTDCPPRAPLGRPDAVYGSSDHLMLLLGRIADFASKDRARKLKQMEANGGQWRPAPGMKMPSPPKPTPGAVPNGAGPGTPAGPPPAQAPPLFFGMAPPPNSNVQMPSSYRSQSQKQTPQAAQAGDPLDLHAATQAALAEYGRIRAALRAFHDALSAEAFQPLAADLQPPLTTPFGLARFYRSYDISCLWAGYNMCVIIAIRSHPHMHPAAHAAAALAAHETAPYANDIGRIAAGIAPGPANQSLNPTLGAALCDSCMPSFFAAVQYQRPDERHETVMRIFGIALRTGWGSAELIANGCETSWVKAGEAGRGPPYQRVIRPRTSDDPRLNGSWERVRMDGEPNEEDERDRRFIKSKPIARLNWAIGIMGMEEDVGKDG